MHVLALVALVVAHAVLLVAAGVIHPRLLVWRCFADSEFSV